MCIHPTASLGVAQEWGDVLSLAQLLCGLQPVGAAGGGSIGAYRTPHLRSLYHTNDF
jgi:hypothetical protein